MIKSIFGFIFVGILAFGDTVGVSPDKLAFGDQVLTTRAFQMVVLSNPTKKDLNIFSITADGDFSIPFTTCGSTLPSSGTCVIYVLFTPTAPGLRTGTLTINDDSPDTPQKVKLSGNGIPVTLVSIGVTPNNASIPLGLTQQFLAMGSYNNNTSQDLTTTATWTSSVPGVAAMISPNGLAASRGQGATSITAASGTVSGSTTLTVTAPVLQSISIAPASTSIPKGRTQQFSATGTLSDRSTQDLTSLVQWSSSAPGVATISPAGLATGAGQGVATIGAVSGAFSAAATLTVTAPVLTSATLTPSNISMGTNRTQQFTLTGTYSDATTANLSSSASWSSSNPGAGSVNASGLFTTFGLGATTISAVLNAGSFGVQKDASVEVAFYQTRSDMTVPRDLHTATLLNDGRVLITGGTTGIQVFVGPRLASSELYDPVSSVFTASGSMSTTREFHTATILPNGKVLIAGGGGPGPSEELYDPATGGFSVTGTMISARAQHTATLLPSGQVLITGGDTTIAATTAELYDPTTGVFSSTGSMSVPRNGHTATLLNDGRVLIAGGEGTTVAETYDPATGTFSNAGNLTTERSYHQATLLNGGKVLLTGGHRNNPQPSASLASAELYDPVNGTFTATSPMSSPREFHTAAALLNGQVLIAGGADGTTFSFLASIEKFDPATGTLPTTGSMSADHTLGVRIAHTATLLQDGRVLLAGGASGSGTIASAELYQPSMRFPAGLSNTKVIPANASISLGSTQRFLQLLGFLDGSTQVAAVATWTSSNPAIAPINWLGMAVGSAVGTAFITATLGFFFFGAGATLQVK